jgi:3-oxoadipate enol-lactonase
VGEEDVVTPPDVGRAMGEQLPETRVLTLPLAGHLTSLEAPAEFNAAVVELLAEVRRPRQQAAGFRGESVRR